MAVIIDGKAVAAQVDENTALGVERLRAVGITPGLAVVLVGEDPASQTYVRMKERACERLGLCSFDNRMPGDTSQADLEALVGRLNADPEVHGILVQLPLPKHLDAESVLARISPDKDVDGLHPTNLGKLVRGLPGFRPATPWGVMKLLDAYGIDPAGKEAVVIGRSTLVGKPLALMLLERNATVTQCHSRTADLAAVCRRADILCSAVGSPRLVGAGFVKPGAVVIDVGTIRTEEGLVGDVDFAEVEPLASVISPVPGGVGPMTIAMLMANTVASAAARAGDGR